MGSIITSTNMRKRRQECRFVLRRVLIHDEDGVLTTYPDIVLQDDTTGLPICYTGLEYIAATFNDLREWQETYRKKWLTNIVQFLNYLLHHTDISRISQVDIDIIKDFNLWYKTKEDGTMRAAETWRTCLNHVYRFLDSYYFIFQDKESFAYSPTQLFKVFVPDKSKPGGTATILLNKQGVRAPRDSRRKNRVIYGEHLKLLFWCAEKYDPMLAFPLKLEAAGGLREGEPVNLTRSSIKVASYGARGLVEPKVRINLLSNASYNTERRGITPSGSIKRLREQEIYPDFVHDIIKAYEEHLTILDVLKKKTGKPYAKDKDEPLLLNKWGDPMTVDTYSKRVKKLFYEHFLPELKRYSLDTGRWEEDLPYILQYEAEYPGLHMCRHWFTMYLITHTNLKEAEIAYWRGDRSLTSYRDYVHATADMQALFRQCSFIFHKHIMEGGR